nr:hypothetical protein [Candidatus Cloacimonadota bacterium]
MNVNVQNKSIISSQSIGKSSVEKYWNSHVRFYFILLIVLSFFLFSCSDPKLDNPFDPNSSYNLDPMSGALTLTQLSDSQVRLRWILNSSVVGNYIIKRKIGYGDFEIIATVDKDLCYYVDTELLTTNTYYYQLIGANGDVQTKPLSNSIQTSFV